MYAKAQLKADSLGMTNGLTKILAWGFIQQCAIMKNKNRQLSSLLRKKKQCNVENSETQHQQSLAQSHTKQIQEARQSRAAVLSGITGIVGQRICPAAVVSCLSWRKHFLSMPTFCFLFLCSLNDYKWQPQWRFSLNHQCLSSILSKSAL